MFIDCSELTYNPNYEFDLCIIGGGVAGITLALELEHSGLKIALLEGGGEELTSESQSLYQGQNIGKEYYDLHTSRIRFLGGTSNHWGGNCRELQSLDFEYRDWIPGSGWPIKKSDLTPYYGKAAQYCKITHRDNFYVENRITPFLKKPIRTEQAKLFMTQYAPETHANDNFKALSFGKAYSMTLKNSNNITVFLNANVTELIEHPDQNTIESIQVFNNKQQQISFRAKRYVLSAGGLENARILLVSNKKHKTGIGNKYDQVGRNFQEHISIAFGVMIPQKEDLSYFDLYDNPKRRLNPTARNMIRTKSYMTFTKDLLQAKGIANTTVSIRRMYLPASQRSKAYKSFKTLVAKFKNGAFPDHFHYHLRNVLVGMDDLADGLKWKYFNRDQPIPLYRLSMQAEQAPNKDSRVTLSDELDMFGKPKIRLNWQLSDLDFKTVRETAALTARELGATGEGRVVINLPKDNKTLHDQLKGDWHHMGTTRMSDDPKEGVVDANCKIHGLDNIYIAGSSVFPTGGHSVPTFTIVALAARLAAHLNKMAA